MRLYRTFKTRYFLRWQRKTELSDDILCRAVIEMRAGLIDAQLGGEVVKKRVALPGRGKSGSARTLLATNRGDRWIFLVGFEKNEKDNISAEDLRSLQGYARDLLAWSWETLLQKMEEGAIEEICRED